MSDVFSDLLGGDHRVQARPVYKSIVNTQIKIKLLKILLEETPSNLGKASEYDEIIDEFDSLNRIRNVLIHGLWATHHTGSIFLAEEEPSDPGFFPVSKREVNLEELTTIVARMAALHNRLEVMHARRIEAELRKGGD